MLLKEKMYFTIKNEGEDTSTYGQEYSDEDLSPNRPHVDYKLRQKIKDTVDELSKKIMNCFLR